MTASENNSDTDYDLFKELKRLVFISGYANYERHQRGYYLYKAYRIFQIAIFLTMGAVASIGVVLNYGNTEDMMLGVNFYLISNVGLFSVLFRIIYNRVILVTLANIKDGVFVYKEEILNDLYDGIKRKTVGEIRWQANTFAKSCYASGIMNCVFFPLSQYFLITEDTSEEPLNPYLPQPFYMPFDTRTVHGYAAAYLICITLIFMIITNVICMDVMYVSITGQLKAQFQILNASLENIEIRARFVCQNIIKENRQQANETEQEIFNKCIYDCLKDNVRHHHTLLRLKDTYKNFIGMVLLMVVFLSALIFAADAIASMEATNFIKIFSMIALLIAEMFYTFHYCWYGEELIQESSLVFFTIYSTPWYNYDERFKRIISIMLTNTRKPMENRAAILNISASMESFGSIISSMYQVMNVLRNTF